MLLRADQIDKLREINDRWEQSQRVSRFGNGVIRLLEQAVEDIAYLIVLIESKNDEKINY